MASVEKPLWIKAVEEEFNNMEEHGVFQPIDRSLVPPGAKILSTTWVLKKKASGTEEASRICRLQDRTKLMRKMDDIYTASDEASLTNSIFPKTHHYFLHDREKY
jgi:hypothetical protein